MFDWIWELLYGFSKTIFRLIDGIVQCANILCGLEPIYVQQSNGVRKESDLMSYLLNNEGIGLAFKISALLATILVIIFTIFMIIRTITKDKVEGTPAQLAIKAFKTLLTFFFIPAVIIAFMSLGNIFIEALYKVLQQNATSPGAYLFAMFAQDGGMDAETAKLFLTGELNYYDTAVVSNYFNLSDFPFLFSWIAGGVVLFGVGSSMLIFVDRVLSLVILYIASPISISTSVIDEGARFKLWRDQFLTKFIIGYGMIIALNIYALVCGIVMSSELSFFEESAASPYLDMLMRLLIIAGGALTMQKSMALVGNLVSQGAGSNELRDNAFSMGSLARMAKGVAGKAAGIATSVAGAPLKPVKGILGDAVSLQSKHLGSKLLRGIGLDGGYKREDKKGEGESDSGSKNGEKANYGSNPNSTKDAINDKAFKRSFEGGNTNNKTNQNKKNMVGNAINGAPGVNGNNGKGGK